MTPGHKHRHVFVRSNGLLIRALRQPLIRTTDLARVEASPYPYGVILDGERVSGVDVPVQPQPGEVYVLTLLGILHRWTGLTLEPR